MSGELFDEKTHNDVIDTLKANKLERFDELYKARLNKAQYFALDQDEVNDVIEELVAIREEDKRYNLLDNFYQFLVKEYPTVYYWLQYLEFAILYKSREEFQEIIISALNDTVYDFDGSHKIWKKVLDFFGDLFKETNDPEDLDRLWKLYLKRISIPHRYLEHSYNETSQFVSKHFAQNYNEYMGLVLKVFHKTESKMIYYEKYEFQLSEQFELPNFWSNYIKDVAKYSDDIKQFSSIFYRSLLVADENWFSVWISYIYCLYSKKNNDVYLQDILPKFIKTFPNHSLSYAEAVRNNNLFDKSVFFNTVLSRADYLDLMNNNDYNDWKVLALAMLKYNYSDLLARNYFQFSLKNNDCFHSVEKVVIAIYEQQNRIKDAEKCISQFCRNFPQDFEVWKFALEFYKRNRFDYNTISKFFKDALKYALDVNSPEKLIQEYLEYEQVSGNRISHTNALVIADDLMRQIMEARILQQDESNEIYLNEEQSSRKRHLDEDDNLQNSNKKNKVAVDPIRNREELSVKVTNLPDNITEQTLAQFFSDCGEVKDIIIYLVLNKYESVIEFGSKQCILAALTKSHKRIDDKEIIVQQLHNSIIWVTNFPPNMNEQNLRDLFSESGNIISLRFPTQKTNKVRRFCYIEFSESELTNIAITKFNGKVLTENGKEYKLVVKHSDNQASKKSPLHNREIYISNLDFKVTKQQLITFFSKFGKLEDIILPLKENMKNKGYANGGFGFVIFQSEPAAKQALAENGCKFEGRTINIQPSKKGKPDSINSFDKLTSIVITGFKPTTTIDQIQSFLSKQIVQPYSKILHLPEKQSVVLQFNSIDDSGKASLQLSTSKFDGSELKVKTITEFTKPSTTQKRPALFVPMSIQRR